jgi:TRAP-type C4-dicarboxylate transport system permease small subunit
VAVIIRKTHGLILVKGYQVMEGNEEGRKSINIKQIYEGFCGLLLFLAVSISMAEIVARVICKVSYDLFFDFPVWITVWALLLITGLLLPEGGHLSIDFFRIKAKGKIRWVLEVLLALITLAYGAFITVAGVLFIQQLYLRKSLFPRYIAIPMWIVELCVPIGMGIFAIYGVIGLIKAIRQKW